MLNPVRCDPARLAEGSPSELRRPTQAAAGAAPFECHAACEFDAVAMPANIFLISHARLEREGTRLLLEHSDFVVCGESKNLADLRPTALDVVPDLVLIVLSDSVDIEKLAEPIRALRAQMPETRFTICGTWTADTYPHALHNNDIDGYLSKDISPAVFRRLLRLMLAGERVFPSEVIDALSRTTSTCIGGEAKYRQDISKGEGEILRCLVAGFPNKAIARRLNISESTVKVRIKLLLRKIRAANRTQAAIWALNSGFETGRLAAGRERDPASDEAEP